MVYIPIFSDLMSNHSMLEDWMTVSTSKTYHDKFYAKSWRVSKIRFVADNCKSWNIEVKP
jgi:hypothetical protein